PVRLYPLAPLPVCVCVCAPATRPRAVPAPLDQRPGNLLYGFLRSRVSSWVSVQDRTSSSRQGMDERDVWRLIARHHAGEATASEEAALRALSRNPEYARLLREVDQVWDASGG